ncbi:ubiquinone/menaquinone biosynthesis methyltransferase UbiE [Salmonella sp. NCTC 11881]|nr:ubiquinone/menaquinone biosynthesis methyltransferase UbiE [Salmonella sp. NCTC 11881]
MIPCSKMGREKLRNIGVIGNVEYVQANAEALPFPDNTFDCITISFGLRNVTEKEKSAAVNVPCVETRRTFTGA